jgi:hypothetical protein
VPGRPTLRLWRALLALTKCAELAEAQQGLGEDSTSVLLGFVEAEAVALAADVESDLAACNSRRMIVRATHRLAKTWTEFAKWRFGVKMTDPLP